MKPDKQQYQQMIDRTAGKSPVLKNCLCAFCVGGLLCAVGEAAYQLISMGVEEEKTARMLASGTLILLAAALTVAQVFDRIAKHAGAGTLVPITGFANSVVSPAIEFKTDECDIIGLSRKAP